MLFDPRPKQDKRYLFGRDFELKKLLAALNSGCPLILLLGIRRIGKTSLLKVALRESGQPHIYLDLRALEEEGFSRTVFYRLLSEELTNLYSMWTRLRGFLRIIKGVEVAGVRVELDWGRGGVVLSSLLRALNEWVERERDVSYLTIAFDEAQLLRNMMGGKGRIDFRSLIAYSYDNLPNLKFILTGSEVGLLMDFVGVENAENPLYGRYREEIVLERFNDEVSKEFLRAGFAEHGIMPDEEILDEVVDKLDGVVGWLTYYGYRAVRKGRLNKGLLDEVLEEAKTIVSRELSRIVYRSRYYRLVLKALGMGYGRWIDIKRNVEAWSGRPITSSHLTRLLKSLLKLSIVQKSDNLYHIMDPIIRETVKEY